jgi:nitrogen fixation-related uncharacterized protein
MLLNTPMSASETILALAVLALSTVGYMLWRGYKSEQHKSRDTHVENVLLEIELKKREIRDEINSTSIDDLVKRRNDR